MICWLLEIVEIQPIQTIYAEICYKLTSLMNSKFKMTYLDSSLVRNNEHSVVYERGPYLNIRVLNVLYCTYD